MDSARESVQMHLETEKINRRKDLQKEDNLEELYTGDVRTTDGILLGRIKKENGTDDYVFQMKAGGRQVDVSIEFMLSIVSRMQALRYLKITKQI